MMTVEGATVRSVERMHYLRVVQALALVSGLVAAATIVAPVAGCSNDGYPPGCCVSDIPPDLDAGSPDAASDDADARTGAAEDSGPTSDAAVADALGDDQ
jgi:hypothetical protein